ncbi:MAG: PQQ-binding-like beta-propeller repeat protein, partial [Prosthecobacter sp.]|nr:PQQ-binding-like beta-propeller repeat protein [Prosthecobacter sp.]
MIAACGALLCVAAFAADDPAFEKASLGWRTALHFDPGAEAPLSSLIQLYQRGGRLHDLVNLYAQHVARFPGDEGAKVVLARLYVQTGDGRVEEFITKAVTEHPTNALLAYVRAQWLQSKLDPRALEGLDQAVALEANGPRRALWLGDLLKAAVAAQREDLMTARFTALVKDGALTMAQRLQWARRAMDAGLIMAADAVLEGADFSGLQGDEGIEARFLLARVALAKGRREDATRQAAELLDRLAADHWRYKEAVALRWQAALDEQERSRVLAGMEQRWKESANSEAAALGYGDLLAAAEKKDEALRVWRESLARQPESRLIEERVLDLLEQLRQNEAALEFLAERVRQQPARDDLALRRTRTLLLLGRMAEGMTALEALLEEAAPGDRAAALMQTARWLRTRQLFGESARVLETLIADQPQRWDARKELAELYVLLKRQQDAEALFGEDIPEGLSAEVRLEVAQFLTAQKMWTQARRLLQDWVSKDAVEFEGRLLLSKNCFLLGDEAAAKKLLDECRALSDTEARYAAWLAAAWERADEADKTETLLNEERARLWPKAGETWDTQRLARLSLLAQQTMAPAARADAEKLLRQALAAADLPAAQRRDLRLQLIQVLDSQTGQDKALETEITAALQEPGAAKGDLQLRLALMYHAAQRLDLARSTLAEVAVGSCQDAGLAVRAGKVAEELGLLDQAVALYARLVQLQPDERGHWVAWTSLLMDIQDEAGLRLALREIQSRAKAWKLTEASQDLLRRHLAASYWRTLAGLLTRGEETKEALHPALAVLEELERLEIKPERHLWAVWSRGMVARRLGDQAALQHALSLLGASKEKWVDFPDGLSLALPEATALIQSTVKDLPNKPSEASPPAPVPPLGVAWSFTANGNADLQRWDLSLDGKAVLIADNRRRIYLLDRATGKLLWQRRLPKGKTAPLQALAWNSREGEQIQYPAEWVLGRDCIGILCDDGLYGLSPKDGSVLWQAAGSGGCVAHEQGRILWWRALQGKLDAFDEVTGKLLWSRQAIPPWQAPAGAQTNPQWLATGIHADHGKILVWSDGGAVLRVEDGSILWKAHAGQNGPAFPLELRADETSPAL